jgi:acetyl esterase/lipase
MTRRRRTVLALLAGTLAGCGSTTGDGTTRSDGTTTEETTETPSTAPAATATATPTTTATEGTAKPTDEGPATPPERYSVTVERDVTFRETPQRDLRLNLRLPERDEPSPVLVHVHGGAWAFGDKGFGEFGQRHAAAGVATASIQYRLSYEAPYPAAVQDVAAAVRWVRANADRYGLDPARVALVGGSAGGHLASLVAAAPRAERFRPPDFLPDQPVAVSAVVGHAGVYDMTTEGMRSARLVQQFMGGEYANHPKRYREASPRYQVDAGDPPVYLFHGTEDGVVPYEQATAYREALRDGSVPVSLFTGEGAGHVFYGNPAWFDRSLAAQWAFLADELSVES